MKIVSPVERLPALDLIRALAILLVLISHSRNFFLSLESINPIYLWKFSLGGFLGVEIFFVLSGYLIGLILLKTLWNPISTLKDLKTFLLRRWLRTLPLYLIILIIAFFISGETTGISTVVHYGLFLQNFFDGELKYLPVSWSLAVEEWYYLLVPIIGWMVIKMVRMQDGRNASLIFIIFVVLLSITARALYVWDDSTLKWDNDVRKMVFLRFDMFGIGMILAWISLYREELLTKLSTNGVALISGFVFVLLLTYYTSLGDDGLNGSTFAKILLFPLIGLCIALLMGWLLRVKIPYSRLIYWVSTLSYSVYLTHLFYFQFFISLCKLSDSVGFHVVSLAGALAATSITSYLLYRLIERPILIWRDRISL